MVTMTEELNFKFWEKISELCKLYNHTWLVAMTWDSTGLEPVT